MDLLRLTALLVHTFGAFCYGGMLVLWMRQQRTLAGGRVAAACAPEPARPLDVAGIGLLVVSFLWFVVNLLMTLAAISPAGPSLAHWIAFQVLVFLFPPLIMHWTWTEARCQAGAQPGTPWRVALAGVWVASQAISLFALLLATGLLELPRRWTGRLVPIALGGLFVVAGIYSGLLTARKRRTMEESGRERSSRRWMLGLFGAMAVLFGALLASNIGLFEMSEVLDELFLRPLPLVFLFIGTYYEDRFDFFDLFIKRGLSLLLTIILLTAVFALLLPIMDDTAVGWARPWVFAVALLPVVLTLPWLYSRLGQWLDAAWLGRRFTPVEAVRHFLSTTCTCVTCERELIEQAGGAIAAIFHAPVRIDLGLRAAPPDFDVALEAPIGSGGSAAGAVRLGRRANDTPYFGQDAALLELLAEVFSHMLENVRLQERKQEQENLARDLSMKALRAQINPHFLFNSLNAIAGLIHDDPQKADRTVEQLAEVFRYTLRRSEAEWTLLDEEMDFVRAYLEVEQARFGARLRFQVECDGSLRGARIPAMIVQTLVENAVKHGVAELCGPATLSVRASRQEDRLQIEVTDNGPGPAGSKAKQHGVGYGLKNVRERLAGYFGDAAALRIGRDESRGLTVASIEMPVRRDAGGARARTGGGRAP